MKKLNAGEFLKKYNLLVLLLVFIVISSVLSPNFLKVNNMLNICLLYTSDAADETIPV